MHHATPKCRIRLIRIKLLCVAYLQVAFLQEIGTIVFTIESQPPRKAAFLLGVPMKKSIPGFSGNVIPGKITPSGGGKAKVPQDNKVTTGSNGKGHGMPKGGMLPSKV